MGISYLGRKIFLLKAITPLLPLISIWPLLSNLFCVSGCMHDIYKKYIKKINGYHLPQEEDIPP